MLVRQLSGLNFGVRLPNGTDVETNVTDTRNGKKETTIIKSRFNETDKPQTVEENIINHDGDERTSYHHIYEYNSDGFDGRNLCVNLLNVVRTKSVCKECSSEPSYTDKEIEVFDGNTNRKTREFHSVSYKDKDDNDIIGTNDYFINDETGEYIDKNMIKTPDDDVRFVHNEEYKPDKKEKYVNRYYRNNDGSGVRERWTEGTRQNSIIRYNEYRIQGKDVKYDTPFSYINIEI